MAAQSEGGGKDEIKTHFVTREGSYKLMHHSEYSKPSRVAFNGQTNTPVKLSFVEVNDGTASPDRLCFNVGRELYVYVYKGVRKAADLTKPIDKRIYKGTLPTCHDFNQHYLSPESVLLVVGFTAGQVQLIDPIKKEISKLFNAERLIDKTKVTCIKWIPGSPNQFLVSHGSGQMYLYSEELPCGQTTPQYQPFKQGDGFAVYTCKTRSTRNPLYRWVIGQGAINEFAFSPCARYLAVVGQDGHLRVFQYSTMELLGTMKSFFGGLLCVCWSPDGKYLVTGGEDDLVTVWSFHEKRVVCRGHGHKSWVNMVAFDKYTSTVCDETTSDVIGADGEISSVKANAVASNEGSNHINRLSSTSSNPEFPQTLPPQQTNGKHLNANHSNSSSTPALESSTNLNYISYRFGSVGQDTELCMWDLTEDVLKQPYGKSRTSSSGLLGLNSSSSSSLPRSNSLPSSQKANSVGPVTSNDVSGHAYADGHAHPIQNAVMNASSKFATLSVSDRKESSDKKEHKRNFSLAARNSDKSSVVKSNNVRPVDSAMKLYGTQACPKLDQVPMLEPLVCKKVSHERLTAIAFRNECIVTACQEGIVLTWARPGKVLRDGVE
ncbi:WD repeat-containing protein 20 [Aplysia californica]|uniref:WD repeat-containing protein 20 n=1 Tax=Aplysia californica TaxID=6500 RepID=A0ABM0JVY1_APLCA|nr:WD repeat-containing protein 20 [Aplysia californica]